MKKQYHRLTSTLNLGTKRRAKRFFNNIPNSFSMSNDNFEIDNLESERWNLVLYVAGSSSKSTTAIENLKQLCNSYLRGKCEIEVIDLTKNPKLAKEQQILAIPVLVRRLPEPMKKIIGDLSNNERVLVGLDIKTRKTKTENLL